LTLGDYLSLMLLGLLNPVVGTMRGLCAASHLQRVQQEVCRRPVSLGSFSEAQAVLDPVLLQEVFGQLSRSALAAQPEGQGQRRWLVQDSSLFEALPRMYWCLWRRQGCKQSQVRLHLSLDVERGLPVRADITPGKTCERAVWRRQFQRGDAYIADRYFGEDYQLFAELTQAGVVFVVRLREAAVLRVQEELPLTPLDKQAGVLRQAWVKLGGKGHGLDMPMRVVWVQTPKEVLMLATNLKEAELPAAEVALLYQQRWQIELFFRWVKCILGCRHWLAESPQGVAIQVYLALIAALLLQLYTGQKPNRRMMELIQFYLQGMATLEELWTGMKRQREALARREKI
jgi:Transposase DDE domain